MQRTFPHMQLSLIHFSSNEVCYCSCSREATLSCCVYCGSPNCRIYIGNTQKNTFVVRGYRVHISEKWLWHRPQSPTGLFTAPFGGSAQRVAVGCYEPPFLRNCTQRPRPVSSSFSITASTAVPLRHCNGREGETRYFMESVMTPFCRQMDTETGTRLWTWVKAPRPSASCTSWRGEGGGVYLLTAMRWIGERRRGK